MDKTCKYYKYQKYVSYDSGHTWSPLQEFQRGELMEFNSPDCGSSADEIYKWVLMDVSTDYYCAECPSDIPSPTMYRWNLGDISDYICSGTTKCYKQYKQYSSDGGIVWQNVYPVETKMTNIVIENLSSDCGVAYAWRPRPINEEYVCSGGTMYYKEYYQVTYNYGETWQDVTPTSSRTGNMYSECAGDCGCGGTNLLRASYNNSTEYIVLCSSGGRILTSGITRGYSTSYTAMTEAYIGSCVTSIYNNAFAGGSAINNSFSHLSSVTIDNGVETIGYNAFLRCMGLTSIDIPDSVTSIGATAFAGCSKLSGITIGSGVTYIGDDAFSGCTSLPIENNIRYADICTVEATDKALASYTIKNGTKFIGSHTFWNCSGLTSVTIPNSVTHIFYGAFNWCENLTSIEIPNSLTYIGYGAFTYCKSLSSVTIPENVTSIGDWAFEYCSSLTSVTVNAVTPPTLGDTVFNNTNNCPIYVPSGSVDAYKTASGWSSYASRIQAIQ